MNLPPDLRARILDAARREPAPTRADAGRRATLAIACGYAMSIALLLLTGGAHVAQRSVELVAVTAAGWIVVALGAAWGGYDRGRSMLGRPTVMVAAVALATAPLLLAWVAMCTGVWSDGTVSGAHAGDARAHAACFAFTVMYAAAPLAGFLVARRGSDPVHPRATGAALGAAAGAWGGVMIDLHCARTGMVHVAIAHVLPVLALAAVGALLGARLLAIRADEAHHS